VQSKAGPVLIALNPFKDLQIYGNNHVSSYRQQSVDTPHVYGMVDAAYNQMMRGEWRYFPTLCLNFYAVLELRILKVLYFACVFQMK
jgi:hypothetical protein